MRSRVLERVREALLDDAIGGQVERRRQRHSVAPHVELDGKAGAPKGLQQRVEAAEAGLRSQLHVLGPLAHGAEEAAHLAERVAAGLLDARERLPVPLQLGRQLVPHGPDLEHHDADGVRDDVVQLAGDPRALLRDGDTGRRLALPLRVIGTRLRHLGVHGALAQGQATEPRDREESRREDEVARRVVGVVRDDDRQRADLDRQPHAAARRVPKLAEQERRGQSRDGDRGGPDHQPAVCEGEAQRPGGRRPPAPRTASAAVRAAAAPGAPQPERRTTATSPVRPSGRRAIRARARRERPGGDQQVQGVTAGERLELGHTPKLPRPLARRLLRR